MKPQSYPEEMKKSLVKAKPLPISRREACPYGTVPIQRTTKDDLLKARNYSNEFFKNIGDIADTKSPNHVRIPHMAIYTGIGSSPHVYV
jgi:hypothetical protein